jgi:ribonuclease E
MGSDAEQGQERQGVGKPHQQREEADQERDRMTQPTGGDLSEISKGITDDLDEDDLDEDDLDEDDLDDEDEEHDRITQRSPTQEG